VRRFTQSPKTEYILDIYFAAAALDFEDHFAHQYRNQSLSCIVSCLVHELQSSSSHPETALGFSADSTTAKYFISNGTFFAKASSKKREIIFRNSH
jgi:hypothetical protein